MLERGFTRCCLHLCDITDVKAADEFLNSSPGVAVNLHREVDTNLTSSNIWQHLCSGSPLFSLVLAPSSVCVSVCVSGSGFLHAPCMPLLPPVK